MESLMAVKQYLGFDFI